MYDGLSKSDLRIILAYQKWRDKGFYGSCNKGIRLKNALFYADYYLDMVEALNAESDSSQRRDDGEGEGPRA